MSPEERGKLKYSIRIKKPYHKSIKITNRRDIARLILKQNSGNGKLKGITEHLFNLVISRIMELKAEQMFVNGYTELDQDLGSIRIIGFESTNKDFNKLSINWDRTLDLWIDNPVAKEKKKLVRYINNDQKFKVTWVRGNGVKNIAYYSFKPSRTLRRKIYYSAIKDNNITFLTDE